MQGKKTLSLCTVGILYAKMERMTSMVKEEMGKPLKYYSDLLMWTGDFMPQKQLNGWRCEDYNTTSLSEGGQQTMNQGKKIVWH